MKKIWTKFQPTIPCKECEDGEETNLAYPKGHYCRHKSCRLWYEGWRVGVRHILWFRWLEFTKEYNPFEGSKSHCPNCHIPHGDTLYTHFIKSDMVICSRCGFKYKTLVPRG